MVTALRTTLAVLLVFTFNSLFGQAPHISYSTPQVFEVGAPVAAILPVNTGGAVPAYPVSTLDSTNLYKPRGMAVDQAGNIYFINNTNTLQMLPAGGGNAVNLSTGTDFLSPTQVAVDAAGNIFVASGGDVKEVLKNGGGIVLVSSGFRQAYGVTLDGTGNLYVSDFDGGVVEKIVAGSHTATIIGSGFSNPCGLAVDAAGNVFVADKGNHQIVEIPSGGGQQFVVNSSFHTTVDVKIDAAGNLYIADASVNLIEKIPVGSSSASPVGSGFSNPASLAIDANGNVYVADQGSNTIKRMFTGGYRISPNLPAGLNFEASSGAISGIPTVVKASANYTVTALNSAGSNTATINITVNALQAPVISYTSPSPYTVGAQIPPLAPHNTGGPAVPTN